MTYISEILWYATFPVTIIVGYQVVKWALKKLDKPQQS
jgi:hypothetical protein